MKIYDKPTFECEFCGKVSKTKPAMIAHEKSCKKNPCNICLCYSCRHYQDEIEQHKAVVCGEYPYSADAEKYFDKNADIQVNCFTIVSTCGRAGRMPCVMMDGLPCRECPRDVNIMRETKMKKFTDHNQTAHLKRLGFPEPADVYIPNGGAWIAYPGDYSIGDLIDFLICPVIRTELIEWVVIYSAFKSGESRKWRSKELIDALYLACVQLKREGEILCKK